MNGVYRMDSYRSKMPPIENEATKIALCLVLDISISMNDIDHVTQKSYIQLLNDGVNFLISSVSKNPRLSEDLHLSIITFGEENQESEYQGFAPICNVQPVSLQASHRATYATNAIENTIPYQW